MLFFSIRSEYMAEEARPISKVALHVALFRVYDLYPDITAGVRKM